MICTRVEFPSMQSTPGIGQSVSIAIGHRCSPTWGGGVISRIEIDRELGAALFYKDVPFDDHKAQRFASVAIPLARLKCWTMVDEPVAEKTAEKTADPPAAKPTQNQGNSQRR